MASVVEEKLLKDNKYKLMLNYNFMLVIRKANVKESLIVIFKKIVFISKYLISKL